MIAYLQGITQQRWSWMLLLVSALFLELCAMVFQHGLGLFPCLMCRLHHLHPPARAEWRTDGAAEAQCQHAR